MEANIINDNFVHDSNYKRIYIKQSIDYKENEKIMKELSIEEKAKRYDELLEKSKHYHREMGDDVRCVLEEMFHELKESEDDKVRKKLIHLVKKSHEQGGYALHKWEADEMLAWFEKQGKPIDKVEPKFHEGEWVVFNNRNDSVYQVEKIENYEYTLRHFLGGSMPLSFSHEDMIRAWTVKDARHGDVLWCETGWTCIFKTLNSDNISFSSYCFMDYTGCGCFCETGSESHKAFIKIKAYNGNIHPATKEQRDLLFSKMKEAGYEWDANHKQLNKIVEL